MKYYSLIIAFLFLACNTENKKLCIEKIDYNGNPKSLGTPSLLIRLRDDSGKQIKKIETGKLTKVLLFSLKENEREYFFLDQGMFNQYKKDKNTIDIKLLTAFFIDTPFRKHTWTPTEIQKKIEGDIGLVFEKDTIRVKMCEK